MKILVFGSNGLVGNSLRRVLDVNKNFKEIFYSSREDTDLFNIENTSKTISSIKPDIVINAAAKVGGIHANNTKRTEFIFQNLKINMNILEIKWLLLLSIDKNRHIHALKDPPAFSTSCGWVFF